MFILEKNKVLSELISKHIDKITLEERLTSEQINLGICSGTMVLLGNPKHSDVKPTLIGQPARIKVNANIGTSPLESSSNKEMNKLKVAYKAGADTVMDLSTGGDLYNIREKMLVETSLPLGTVPLYAVAQKYIKKHADPAKMDPEELFEEIERQAEQGVDFMTLHCGVTYKAAELGSQNDRVLGIVSRGGALLARWMFKNKKENPLYTEYDRLLKIASKYNVTISLGDGLRPGGGCDAGDSAQWEELMVLGELTRRGQQAGVQCMIEGPGHVRLHEVEAQVISIKKLTHGAPLYVLGPLVIDSSPGYDHISGAIGAAVSVRAGVDFLCYLTPAEHLSLPNEDDVYQGVMASRIAAQAGEVSLGRPLALEREACISESRKKLDWDGMQNAALDANAVVLRREPHKKEKVCSMCGDFCSMDMLNDKW